MAHKSPKAGADQADLRPEKSCPIPQAHSRLHQAHSAWHQTLASYPEPDSFCVNLNATIQALRSVTFRLQSEKRAIPDFEQWYEGEGGWRDRMRADPLMKWLHDARTEIDKRGDLETHSTARVTVVAGWLGGPVADVEIPPLVPPSEIAEWLGKVLELPERVQSEGVLVVERRWVAKTLPGCELLDALARAYGFVATVLRDAHKLRGMTMRTFADEGHGPRPVRAEHLGGRLPCMVAPIEGLTARLHLGSGELAEIEVQETRTTPERMDAAGKRYSIGPGALLGPGASAIDQAARLNSIAKRMLTADRYHQTIAFLFTADAMEIYALHPEDQGDKYLMMARLAREVELYGFTGIVFVTEVWMAPLTRELLRSGQRAAERPDRVEALAVTAANEEGQVRTLTTPFSRTEEGEIRLTETDVAKEPEAAVFLEPILRVWRSRERTTPTT